TKSYTIHTMTYFKEQNPKTDFYFIIGADMVEYLPYWNSIDDHLELVTFVCVNREGYSIERDYPIIKKTIPNVYISSSNIKKSNKNNYTINYIVTKEIDEYIEKFSLYENK